MTCKACRKRIAKSLPAYEIIDTVFVEALPVIGRWGRFDPPGFLHTYHSVLDRDNKNPNETGALRRVGKGGDNESLLA